MLKPEIFFDLENYEHKALFENANNVWEALNNISKYIEEYLAKISVDERIRGIVKSGAILMGDNIYIGEGAKIEPTAYIEGPAIIGPESIIGTAAYIRGGTILGRHCIIGHCTEAKNTIMLDGAAAPHFNFIGDSILGNNVNIGAGVILANFRLDAKPVPFGDASTGLVKLGAILGDRVKIGCNSVLEPGTFLGPDTWILPTTYFKKGYYRRGEKRREIIKEIRDAHMFIKAPKKEEKNMKEIYLQVPPDYWDVSYKNNVLQRIFYDLRFRALQKILKHLPDGSNILDIGCGSGFSMEKSIPKGKSFEVCGVDVTEKLINYAKEKRPQFNFSLACGENLPFEEKKFDAVLYLDVIEHLIDPVKSLGEARRVLKDGGFVIVLVIKENHPLFRIIWWLWKKTRGKVWEDAHLRIYDEKLLKKHLNDAGFNVFGMKMEKIHFGMSLIAVAHCAIE